MDYFVLKQVGKLLLDEEDTEINITEGCLRVLKV